MMTRSNLETAEQVVPYEYAWLQDEHTFCRQFILHVRQSMQLLAESRNTPNEQHFYSNESMLDYFFFLNKLSIHTQKPITETASIASTMKTVKSVMSFMSLKKVFGVAEPVREPVLTGRTGRGIQSAAPARFGFSLGIKKTVKKVVDLSDETMAADIIHVIESKLAYRSINEMLCYAPIESANDYLAVKEILASIEDRSKFLCNQEVETLGKLLFVHVWSVTSPYSREFTRKMEGMNIKNTQGLFEYFKKVNSKVAGVLLLLIRHIHRLMIDERVTKEYILNYFMNAVFADITDKATVFAVFNEILIKSHTILEKLNLPPIHSKIVVKPASIKDLPGSGMGSKKSSVDDLARSLSFVSAKDQLETFSVAKVVALMPFESATTMDNLEDDGMLGTN